jgi:hypothetical protein
MDTGEVITLTTLTKTPSKALEVWGTPKGLSLLRMTPPQLLALGRNPVLALAVADQLTMICLTLSSHESHGPIGMSIHLLPSPAATRLQPSSPSPPPGTKPAAAAIALLQGKQAWEPILKNYKPVLKDALQALTKKYPDSPTAPQAAMYNPQESAHRLNIVEQRPMTADERANLGLSPLKPPPPPPRPSSSPSPPKHPGPPQRSAPGTQLLNPAKGQGPHPDPPRAASRERHRQTNRAHTPTSTGKRKDRDQGHEHRRPRHHEEDQRVPGQVPRGGALPQDSRLEGQGINWRK